MTPQNHRKSTEAQRRLIENPCLWLCVVSVTSVVSRGLRKGSDLLVDDTPGDLTLSLTWLSTTSASTPTLTTSGHAGSRNIALLVHEIEVACLLLDTDFCNFFCHDKSPPSHSVLVPRVATPGCGEHSEHVTSRSRWDRRAASASPLLIEPPAH